MNKIIDNMYSMKSDKIVYEQIFTFHLINKSLGC